MLSTLGTTMYAKHAVQIKSSDNKKKIFFFFIKMACEKSNRIPNTDIPCASSD